jgi:uncharacterized membrane protein YjjP (DUF1212 family)
MSQLSDNNITDLRSLDTVLNAPDRTKPIGFILRLAKALHTYGLPAYELEQTMNGCAEAMGYGMQCLSLPTSINLTLLEPREIPKTFLIRVSPGEINIDRLRRTTEVARKVINGSMNVKDGAEQLKKIADSQAEYSKTIIILSFALTSASIAGIFSAGINDILMSGLIGLIVGMLAIIAKKSPILDHLLPSICAFFSTFLTISIGSYFEIPLTTSIVIISGLIILLPGLSLTIALAELATQHLVSGTARLSGTITTFIQLAFGSALGKEVSNRFHFFLQDAIITPVPLWTLFLSVSLASIALIPLFSARKNDILLFLLAALTAFTSVYFGSLWLGASLGAFIGAIIIGLMAKIVTHFFDIPGATIIMPGFIILVPGSVGYKSILALVEKDIITGLSIAFDVGIIGISLVAGFLISSLVPLPKNTLKSEY